MSYLSRRGLLFPSIVLLTASTSPLAAQIQDNSFLLEEAYNQEAGVVQHISNYARTGGDWAFSFTQEWPLGGIKHQLSYTIPFLNTEERGTGLGDVALNYRYQLAGNPQARVVAAPRLSLLLPTGSEAAGRGRGGLGAQVDVPVTLVLSEAVVTHWNAGVTLTPSARNAAGDEATTYGFNLGGSVVWLARPRLNLLLETVWYEAGEVASEGRMTQASSWVLNPGVRTAFDFGNLQVVPGAAYTVGLGPDGGEAEGLFLYLSFEHPFASQ
ncbi:MAG TPA: transporter [Gemmatimonadales bacterium]|nr:transporter [Gemmatimonadales bacterium]